ncbi:hypothetical protein PR048_003977 [Dryococelus australis]|uniref:Uncharacterized protein n=1 Tax=Dryococelus australis TaxID=614101 RepID=A0ABQ9I484_9NEOP|nr:hypothetical protein PR048_003977 [Dryococelus australis]
MPKTFYSGSRAAQCNESGGIVVSKNSFLLTDYSIWTKQGCPQFPIKRLRLLARKEKKKTVCKVSSVERGQTVTDVCSMSTTGIFVPSSLISHRKRTNTMLYKDAPTGTLPLINDTGYMNSDLFLEWLNTLQYTVLLIADKTFYSLFTQCSFILQGKSHNISNSTPHASHLI